MRIHILISILITLSPIIAQSSNSSSPSTPNKIHKDQTTGMEFVLVPGGCYQIGQSDSEKSQLLAVVGEARYNKFFARELPSHEVCVDDLFLGKYEVTIRQWRRFINATDYVTDAEKDAYDRKGCYILTKDKWSYRSGYYWDNTGFNQEENQPVTCISHNDAQSFISWLNKESGLSYRLPTEAEWEYAARGGKDTMHYWDDKLKSSATCDYANVADRGHNWKAHFDCEDGYKFTSPVGTFSPNAYGLYDMLGNVWEWCINYYDEDYYKSGHRDNPVGPISGTKHVTRGVGWDGFPTMTRAAVRSGLGQAGRGDTLGFRLALPAQR